MNILGPVTNPAGARRQVIGVADPGLLDLVPQALLELGHLRALVVHGSPGMDEVSPVGPTRVVELRDGELRAYEVTPEALGLEPADVDGLRGGDPARNAEIVEAVLAGEPGAPRTAVVMNAAAALLVGGAAEDWESAARLAESTIDSGGAASALERLRTASQS
jgi:anthranilate phosphoribosyltransferase